MVKNAVVVKFNILGESRMIVADSDTLADLWDFLNVAFKYYKNKGYDDLAGDVKDYKQAIVDQLELEGVI